MSFTEKIKISPGAAFVLERLNKCGHRAYIVGGCVRDNLLGCPLNDFDITTSALPEETAACFPDRTVIKTGIKHGTVTVVSGGENIEVTTFRLDGNYTDGRHPENVTFTDSLTLDLARRDFTVNAMAYSENEGIADPFGGVNDLHAGIIRCVGEPDRRFGEDALRILRALRFASVLGFDIEESTLLSLRKLRALLSAVSAERIYSEFVRLLCGKNAAAVLTLCPEVFCEFLSSVPILHGDKFPLSLWEYTAETVGNSPPQKELRLAAFFHAFAGLCGYSASCTDFYRQSALLCESVLTALKSDTHTKKAVCDYIESLGMTYDRDERDVRRGIAHYGIDFMRAHLELKKASAIAGKSVCREKITFLSQMLGMLENTEQLGICTAKKDLAVSGNDLIGAGIERGPLLGKLLDELFEKVCTGDLPNEKEKLISYAAKAKDEYKSK